MTKKRSLIERLCPMCKKTSLVRKDGVGIYCRSCKAKLNQRKGHYKDMAGYISGKLKVIEFSCIKNKQYHWKCLCECGNYIVTSGNKLRKSKIKSCGCIHKTQKGLSTSSTYRSWNAMNQRCYDKKVPHYLRYGGSGITVCDEWRNSFLQFLSDMGERPLGTTLDRIDTLRGYEKENCRWATKSIQDNNRRNNYIIEALGKKFTLSEWSKETGIAASTIRKRINDLNWTLEKSLNKKVKRRMNGL